MAKANPLIFKISTIKDLKGFLRHKMWTLRATLDDAMEPNSYKSFRTLWLVTIINSYAAIIKHAFTIQSYARSIPFSSPLNISPSRF